MFNLKVLGNILIAGAAMGVVATLIEPDTGHIPRRLVPVMIAVPSAAFGALAGFAAAGQEQILLNHVGFEARKIRSDAGVFFLGFYLYRTYQARGVTRSSPSLGNKLQWVEADPHFRLAG